MKCEKQKTNCAIRFPAGLLQSKLLIVYFVVWVTFGNSVSVMANKLDPVSFKTTELLLRGGPRSI